MLGGRQDPLAGTGLHCRCGRLRPALWPPLLPAQSSQITWPSCSCGRDQYNYPVAGEADGAWCHSDWTAREKGLSWDNAPASSWQLRASPLSLLAPAGSRRARAGGAEVRYTPQTLRDGSTQLASRCHVARATHLFSNISLTHPLPCLCWSAVWHFGMPWWALNLSCVANYYFCWEDIFHLPTPSR